MTEQKKNLILEQNKEPIIRLSSLIGPFNHIHRQIIIKEKTNGNQELQILPHPLSCFEIILEIYLGPKLIIKTQASPNDFKPITPFQQLISFNFSLPIPAPFYSISSISVKLSLIYSFPGIKCHQIATGTTKLRPESVIFPLLGKKNRTSEIPVVCDLMRLQFSSNSIPYLCRSPSPTLVRDGKSLTFDHDIPELAHIGSGDIAMYSGNVTDTFSALLIIPENFPPLLSEVPSFSHPHYFATKETPPNAALLKLRYLINRPFIEGIPSNQHSLVNQYSDFISRSASGYLKIASISHESSQRPYLPPALALTALLIPKCKKEIYDHALECLQKLTTEEINLYLPDIIQTILNPNSQAKEALYQFILKKSESDPVIAVSTYWALKLEKETAGHAQFASECLDNFSHSISQETMDDIRTGETAFIELEKICTEVKTVQGKENKKEHVKKRLSSISYPKPFRLPLFPSFIVSSISTDNIIVFGSSLQPVKMDFVNAEGLKFSAILKVGDDMRQDQLAIMAVRYMDVILKHYALDKNLSPYAVLPMSRTFGLSEFVANAQSISKILAKNETIDSYFDKEPVIEDQGKKENLMTIDNNNNSTVINQPKKLQPNQRFQESCAAYTVMSYLLGVGDRHLDNLLCTPKGNFFHVDFGFMFGQDPKPMPAPVRVVDQMVTAMSDGQDQFVRECVVVHNAMRKHSDEFCSLIALMRGAELPHMPKTDALLSAFLTERLCLEMTERDAGKKIVKEVDNSISAIMPKVCEYIHGIAQRV